MVLFPTLSLLLLLKFAWSTKETEEIFLPQVEWNCSPNSIEIKTSANPFLGIAKSSVVPPRGCSVFGIGDQTVVFSLDLTSQAESCGLHFNQEKTFVWLEWEVHRHPLLIMSLDRTFNVSCHLENLPARLKASTETYLEDDSLLLLNNAPVDEGQSLLIANSSGSSAINPVEEFALELAVMEDDIPQTTVLFGGLNYSLEARLRPLLGRLESPGFRLHSCWASPVDGPLREAEQQRVQLVDERGCVSQLLSPFHSLSQGAQKAQLSSMFRFARSSTVRFECSFELCGEGQRECKPDCIREDPKKEDEEMGSGVEPQEEGPSTSRGSSSVVVHVVDKRQVALPDNSNCITSNELLFVYKLCIGLCFVFVLGCCLNILFCCMSRNWSPKKETKKKRLAVSVLLDTPTVQMAKKNNNEFWIPDSSLPLRDTNETTSFYGSSHYGQTMEDGRRRNSITSYASVKHRGRIGDYRLSNSTSEGVSIRPYGPSPPANSTFQQEPCSVSTTTSSLGSSLVEDPCKTPPMELGPAYITTQGTQPNFKARDRESLTCF